MTADMGRPLTTFISTVPVISWRRLVAMRLVMVIRLLVMMVSLMMGIMREWWDRRSS
jgi:hypothetical protein